MRKTVLTLALTALLTGASAAPALAGPVPSVPKDCKEFNALLHIDNVRNCDDPDPEGGY